MKRRVFLEGVLAGSTVTVSCAFMWGQLAKQAKHQAVLPGEQPIVLTDLEDIPQTIIETIATQPTTTKDALVVPEGKSHEYFAIDTLTTGEFAQPEQLSYVQPQQLNFLETPKASSANVAQSYQAKIDNFDTYHEGDVVLSEQRYELLKSTLASLTEAQRIVGHGNFNIINLDTMLKTYARYSKRGAFPKEQLDFIDEIFSAEAKKYGFFGEKIITQLSAEVPEKEISKIPGTGHFLFHGEAHKLYDKVRSEVGDSLVLTSGIRGVMKQLHLFMAKAVHAKGNLSQASRSLAPPGHSYHAIGDFDVGCQGLGKRNFTKDFAETDVFKKLQDLGYVNIRYTLDNHYGVRYEPWHIKVV
ncbi:M15 family metallopeptidase [Zooshikella harenae]|uniref:M15 family metallopeptidase n=1 Tax=Zooshikella harenae TaxID=2827238 RepID=A0ABS5Z9Q6_9GAMM|nr:M15 family metallopeptidase [Zooshikella harenae]MBU2710025.1 M15 family metallopeptidase [Zooshikella harenae]